jgi:Amt family ammonium transporter
VVSFDKIKIDDPVGAISVHLVCGIWGTLAVGIFSVEHSFLIQLLGVGAYGLFTVACAFTIFFLIKVTMGLRVDEEEEMKGLDISEHGMESYADFQPASDKLV